MISNKQKDILVKLNQGAILWHQYGRLTGTIAYLQLAVPPPLSVNLNTFKSLRNKNLIVSTKLQQCIGGLAHGYGISDKGKQLLED